jgi:O-antigen/teichoic acid export membrane protein
MRPERLPAGDNRSGSVSEGKQTESGDLRNLLLTFGMFALFYGAAGVGTVLSARLLQPEGQGQLAAAMLWATLLSLLGMIGIHNAMVYYSAARPDETRNVLASGLVLSVITGCAIASGGILLLPVLLGAQGAPMIQATRMLLVGYVPSFMAYHACAAVLQGRLRLTGFSWLRPVPQLVYALGLGALLLLHSPSLGAALSMWLVGQLLGLAGLVFLLRRTDWLSGRPSWPMTRELAVYGAKSQLGGAALLLNGRLDQMLLAAFFEPRLLGLYSVAVAVAATVSAPSQAIAFVAFPRLSACGTPGERSERLGRFLRLALALALIPCTILITCMPWLLRTFLGEAYEPASTSARLLVLASVVLAARFQLEAGLKAFALPLVVSHAELLSLGVTGVGLALMLRPWGIAGAAAISLVAYSVSCLYMLVALQRAGRFGILRLVSPTRADWAPLLRLRRLSWR